MESCLGPSRPARGYGASPDRDGEAGDRIEAQRKEKDPRGPGRT